MLLYFLAPSLPFQRFSITIIYIIYYHHLLPATHCMCRVCMHSVCQVRLKLDEFICLWVQKVKRCVRPQ